MRSTSNRVKRFYKTATVDQDEAGFFVSLDSRVVKTVGKSALRLPTLALAEAIADEWRSQDEFIDWRLMGLNTLANEAIDYVGPNLQSVIDETAGFGGSDLLCYRAEAPLSLIERQSQVWDPLIAWAQNHYGARLAVTTGILHIAQPAETIALLTSGFDQSDKFTLAAFRAAVGLCGSLILGLALFEGELLAEQAWQAAQLDEDWQSERWGRDAEAIDRSNNGLAALQTAHRMKCLLGQ